MRVMLDTNIIISYILFKNETMQKFYDIILNKEELIISDVIIAELQEVFNRKFKNKTEVLSIFLETLVAECITLGDKYDETLFEIRDKNDYPILYSAIKGNVDIFITGDEDFKNVVIEKPRIMTINEYLSLYC